ncbi:MAG TPA: tetratricopeptide repeat protein [Pyrinomonadaceae bacterium]|nr:tetratricopeptide repeat protein [Pyrinomonadaceae bacterium]
MQSRLVLTTIALAVALAAASAARAQGGESDLERAAALISGNRLAEAEQQLSAILKLRPNDALALNLLGTVRAQQGRLEDAETLFTRAARADARFIGARMNLAHLYTIKREPSKAAALFAEVLKLDASNPEAAYRLARLHYAEGRLEECLKVAEAARRAGALTPQLLVVLGDAYLKKGDAAKAEESYLRALGADVNNADALLGVASAAQARNDPKTAALYLARARDLVGDAPERLYAYALVALKTGLYEDARLALERAYALRPDEPAYTVALGAVWLKKAELFEAERAFRRALAVRADGPQAQMYLGYTLLKQKKYAEAREWLEKSAAADATSPETFYYLGVVTQEQGEDARAAEMFARAVKLSPTFANAHVALGSVYLKQKDYERARAELEEGARLNPDDAKAHYNLARLYAQLKDPARAQREMAIVERLKNAGKSADEDASAPSSPR